MFLLGQIFLINFVIRVPFQSLNLQLCGKLFCNERSSLGIEQHLIKSMFVFCLISSLLFSALKFRHSEATVPLYTYIHIHHSYVCVYRKA